MGQGFGNQRVGVNIAAGASTAQSGTVVFSNANGVTFGMIASASSSVITASLSAIGVGAISAFGSSNSGVVSFADSNGILFGMSDNSVTARGPFASFLEAGVMAALNSFGSSSSASNLSLQRIVAPFHMSATGFVYLRSISNTANTTAAFSFSIGIYTLTGSSANLASSASNAFSIVGSGQYTQFYSGLRWATIPLASWNITPGDYVVAIAGSGLGVAGGGGGTASMSLMGGSGWSVASADTPQEFGYGVYSAGVSALPSSVARSQLIQSGAAPLAQPYFQLFGGSSAV